MFWFRPTRCPISSSERAWLEDRAQSMVDAIGQRRLLTKEIILPNAPLLQLDDSRAIFDAVGQIFEIDTTSSEVQFRESFRPTTTGERRELVPQIFEDSEGIRTYVVRTTSQTSAFHVAAAAARSIALAYLLDHQLADPDDVDIYHKADLLTVLFGLGIQTANTVLVVWTDTKFRSPEDESQPWSIERSGPVTMPMFGYALAWYHLQRERRRPNWTRYLRPDVRQPFKRALRFIREGSNVNPLPK